MLPNRTWQKLQFYVKLRHSACTCKLSFPEWVWGGCGGGGGAESEWAQPADVGSDGPEEQAWYEKIMIYNSKWMKGNFEQDNSNAYGIFWPQYLWPWSYLQWPDLDWLLVVCTPKLPPVPKLFSVVCWWWRPFPRRERPPGKSVMFWTKSHLSEIRANYV